MKILIDNCIILPIGKHGGEKYFEGAIGISDSIIEFVADRNSREEAIARFRQGSDIVREIDGRGKLAMPGLVNIHGHVSMTLMRGFADDIPLMAWLNDHVWPFEAKMTGDDIRIGAELGIGEMLLGGTTTFVDMYWQEIRVAEAVEKSGIRAVLSPTFTDNKFGEFLSDFELVSEKYGNGADPRISLMIAPHSVYTCSRENLLHARDLAKEHGVGINIHVSETLDEQRTMRDRIGKTPVEYLDELGMLNPRTLAVHCVHVNDSDIETMRKSGVSVAYNPHSNMKISSGIAPVAKMLEEGINVGIGTDGASSNNDLDMWEESRTGSFLQKVGTLNPLVLPAYKVLEMATAGGAAAIGMGDKLGRIESGMLADIILLDIEKSHFYPRHDMVANLVYCAKSSDVDTVIVHGEVVVDRTRLVNMDIKEVCREVDARAHELAQA